MFKITFNGSASKIYDIIFGILLRETRFTFDVMPFDILLSSNLVLEFKNELLQAL